MRASAFVVLLDAITHTLSLTFVASTALMRAHKDSDYTAVITVIL